MNKHALLFFSTLSFGNDKKIHGFSSSKSNTYDQCFIYIYRGSRGRDQGRIQVVNPTTIRSPGADPGFHVRGAHLKKLRRAEGGAKSFEVFRVKNHDFTPKNHIFFQF
jgi:hypothetical protein